MVKRFFTQLGCFVGAISFSTLSTLVHGAAWDACQLPPNDWVVSDQGTGQSMAYAVIPESSGIWIAGSFRGALKIQGVGGSLSLQSASTHSDTTADDCYIAKVGFDGSILSAKAFEGPGRQLVIDGSFDETNKRLLIAGYHLGNITFSPSITLQNKKSVGSGYFDGFMASIDVSGAPTVLWAKSFENTRSTKYSGVSVGSGTNPVGVGTTCAEDKTKNVDPKTGLYPDVCNGYIVSYDKDTGNQQWIISTAGFSPETIRNDGSIAYVIGTLTKAQQLTTTKDGAVTLTPIGTSDIVVLRIDTSNGDISYAVQFGTAGKAYSAWEISLGTNSYYLTGSKDFGTYSGFLIKGVKSTGEKTYEIDIPSSRGVQVDSGEQSIYLMGLFSSTLVLSNTLSLRSQGSYEIFLLKLAASDGEGRWGMTMGGEGMEYPWSLFKDSNNDVYISGLTASSNAKFGEKTFIDNAVGYSNMFITKLKTSAEAMPSCLTSCSNVASGCYIDGQCYISGAASPFLNHGCFKCNPAISKTTWIGPDTSSGNWCYIDGSCVADNKFRDISTSVPATSKCQQCDASSSATAWTLLPGYSLDTDKKTCKSDGSIPAGAVTPGCTGTQTRNENFCGTVTPCYDAATDSCHAAILVCSGGTIYSENCPSFPLKPCYDAATNQCVDSTYKTSTDKVNCGTTGRYIYVDKCPTTHPCYDIVGHICTAAQKDTKSGSGKAAINTGITFFAVIVSVLMIIAA